MKIYILKKEKGKKYESKEICDSLFHFDLVYEGKKPLGCSISDTKNYWAIAFGNCGLDIEEKGRKVLEGITRHLHPREKEYLSGLSFGSSEWDQEFFRIWNCKEAIYKAVGLNFTRISCLNDDLEYKDKIETDEGSYFVHYFEEKSLWGCILCAEDAIEIETVKYAGKHAKAPMDWAMDQLAVRSYSSLELKKKLRTKGYSEEDSEKTISRLLELGYLDDEDYAKRYAENLLSSGKGREYIKQKMLLIGLDPSFMPEIDKEAEKDAAMRIARPLYKRCEDYESQQKLNAKIARRLASRGYKAGLVYSILSELEKENS